MELPDDCDRHEVEVEAKGWFEGAHLSAFGRRYALIFYDPVRLAQEIASEHERGRVFCERNLVVVKSVTKAAMEEAVGDLVRSGRVSLLLPQ